jgi:hypothetical protein
MKTTKKKAIVDFADIIKNRALAKELATVTNNPIVQEYCTRARSTVTLRGEMLVLKSEEFRNSAGLIAYAQAELNGPLSWRELANKAARRKDLNAWVHFYKKAAILLMLIITFSFGHRAFAKDTKAYQTGIISSVERSTGWIDTTRCSGEPGYVACSGGIQNTSEEVRVLTTADGRKLVIHHQMGRPNTVKGVADGTQVQYRWERHMGVDVLLIVVPGSSKEGWYYKEGRK